LLAPHHNILSVDGQKICAGVDLHRRSRVVFLVFAFLVGLALLTVAVLVHLGGSVD